MNKILVLGSGALKIGEAGEFDYSGSQALKALKEEGIYTILINPNIATIQTSEGIADKIYFLPVTPYFVERVIRKEKPDGIYLSFGGQTALNCGVELFKNGILKKYNVKVLGTPVESVINTEDRELFTRKLNEINVKTPKSIAVTSVDQALSSAKDIKYPMIIRSAYTLGGQGSGFCNDDDKLKLLASRAFSYSHQILLEESLKGWKEIEYEVVRDKYDNCITVCNMENFDPLGIHTGESIVVAPSQTLTNQEYHKLRELSIKIIRHIGIIGECNVQYALDPNSEDYRVIEVNARLSRSSALASKATGYPLAFVAAKLGLGYGLHELKNSVTKITTAFFEPSLDYIVVKMPRWDLKKFMGVSHEIGSSMKSVGEVMAIGRNFEEAIQKGIRMIGQGMHGFVANKDLNFDSIEYIKEQLTKPTDIRILWISMAFNKNITVDEIFELTKIDKWFLQKLKNIHDLSMELSKNNYHTINDDLLLQSKKYGFSDFQIARLILKSKDSDMEDDILKIRKLRIGKNIVPFVKQIDTMAAEYPSNTNYLYLTYNGSEHDISFDSNSVIVLGSGAYRIGSSVEFDWCSVNALQTIRKNGYKSIMINYNPETVSTDYDICDKLYFDELSFERVLDIYDLEKSKGVILSMGGQIPNNLALRLHKENVPILGTSATSIDMAEDRNKFSSMLDKLNIDQPEWKELNNINEIQDFCDRIGYPILVRPSYVLSGAAMNIVSNKSELDYFLKEATNVSKQYPVVVSKFIENAKEVEIDAVSNNGEIIAYAISEHVEFAGVHSGDATIVFPAQKIYIETARKIKIITRKISKELNITGPFNIQFLAKDNNIKVIECNLRASRSFPFVSKILKNNLIEMATDVILGNNVERPDKSLFDLEYIGVKSPQFSFSRLHKADPVIGVDMASTGEVGCIADDYYLAILTAMLSVGYRIPKKKILLSTGSMKTKSELLEPSRMLLNSGFELYATKGTAKYMNDNGINTTPLNWPDEDEPNATTYLKNRDIDLVINIPKTLNKEDLNNDYSIRRNSIDYNIPLITNAELAIDFINAFCKFKMKDIEIKSWDEY